MWDSGEAEVIKVDTNDEVEQTHLDNLTNESLSDLLNQFTPQLRARVEPPDSAAT